MNIRRYAASDLDAFMALSRVIALEGDTYPFEDDTTDEEMLGYWFTPDAALAVVEIDGELVGGYRLKANHPGRASHTVTAGYMVAPEFRGQGIGRALAEYSLDHARELGYRGIQFNLIVETNTASRRLWEELGFAFFGPIPGIFRHKEEGYVDAYVVHKDLTGP